MTYDRHPQRWIGAEHRTAPGFSRAVKYARPADARRPVDRVAFLALVLTAVRRSELQTLRWRDVDLIENVLRVSATPRPTPASGPSRSRRAWPRRSGSGGGRARARARTERVFVHPERGTIYRAERFRDALTAALWAAGVDKKLRAFHDLRHTSLTNGAAAGASPLALKTRAGHASMVRPPRSTCTSPGPRSTTRRQRWSGGCSAITLYRILYPPEETSQNPRRPKARDQAPRGARGPVL